MSGKTLKVKVIELDEEKNRFVLSEKDALGTYSDEAREKRLEDNWHKDQNVLTELNDAGWRVAIIWKCATGDGETFIQTMKKLDKWIGGKGTDFFESGYKKRS